MLFVLGDNRDASADSRVPTSQGGAGLIPVVAIEGQVPAVLIGFDFEHPETFASLPPVRWSRTGLSVR
jgi:signal peptidase I